ncbi:hypothetical protein [Geodermatophilus sp. CPCC 206100]|uniref:carboxylate--amine ligase n=1 Tax=Geodermatophilus sp. CPCC 206100 TaxID=3020054 RepID=UPI003B000A30
MNDSRRAQHVRRRRSVHPGGGSATVAGRLVDTSTPVLIVKLGRYPLHHGGVGAIRSLGRLGVPVFAITEDRFTPAAVSRYLSGHVPWPTTGLEDPQALVDGLLRIGRDIGRPAVLLPTDDEAAVLLAERADDLAGAFLYPRAADPGLARRVADKYGLHELCQKHEVPDADAVCPRSPAEVEDFARTARFPVVAKNREPFGRLRAPAVGSTTVVESPDQLLRLAARWPDDPGVLLQEYLPREHAEDWIVHGYLGSTSTPEVLFTGVKVRSWPPHAGITTSAVVVDNAELAALAADFAAQIGYRGILDLDWRYDRRDGRYKLLDFNPRVGAQFRLFETRGGVDVVRAQYLDLTGQPVPAGEQVEGRRFVAENFDLPARLGYGRQPRTLPPLPRRRAGTELAWFARDDLRPWLAMGARMVPVIVRRLLDTGRRRLAVRREAAAPSTRDLTQAL